MDRVIFGDNQFYGINHMSEEKARALSERFADFRDVTAVLDVAYDCGVRGFMLNSNEWAKDIVEYMRSSEGRYEDVRLYPYIPYPHKYANAVAEKGIMSTLIDVVLSDNSAKGVMGMIAKGGQTLLSRDVMKLMELLVDVEMKIFRGMDVEVVFLQNIVTDLLLGLGFGDVLAAFSAYIEKKYGAKGGFMTMNLPYCVEQLSAAGVENPVVCAAINKSGYLMNPGIVEYEEILRSGGFRAVAHCLARSSVREELHGTLRTIEAVAHLSGASFTWGNEYPLSRSFLLPTERRYIPIES